MSAHRPTSRAFPAVHPHHALSLPTFRRAGPLLAAEQPAPHAAAPGSLAEAELAFNTDVGETTIPVRGIIYIIERVRVPT